MKLLDGKELAGFIKQRQAKQVRALIQTDNVQPKLAIVSTKQDSVSELYIRLKRKYGEDIDVVVDVYEVRQSDVLDLINKLNKDDSVHGIIVQLPVQHPEKQDEILNSVAANKDVDGLARDSMYVSATPAAIDWLLNGYNIDLHDKRLLIIGQGRLVGKPLAKLWTKFGYNVTTADIDTENTKELIANADVVVTAAGSPGLVTAADLHDDMVLVDAGVTEVEGQTVGDLASDVYELENIKATPKKGGVGPLTVSALFDNVIRSAKSRALSDAP